MVIIINGQIRADARLADLSGSADSVLVLQEETPGVRDRLAALDGVERVEPFQAQGRYSAFRVIGAADLNPAIFQAASHENWPVRELRRDAPTLETIFNQLATSA